MKPTLRWQIFLAILGFSLIFAILAFRVEVRTITAVATTTGPAAENGPLCTGQMPLPGGVYMEGVLGAPRALNPLLSDLYPVDRELVDLIFDGLTRVGADGRLEPALAQNWTVAEDGRTIRFQLHPDKTWHDGTPVTAADVVFSYSLLQADDFPGLPAVKSLWQSVAISEIDPQTVEFVLSEPYAPFLEATTRGILPAHLLSDLSAQNLVNHPFNLAPVGTGPWIAVPGQDWRQSGQLQLLPNSDYFGENVYLDGLTVRFFPGERELVAAFAAGEIDGILHVSAEMLPALAELSQARLVTTTAPRYTTLFFNVSESGAAGVQETAVRRALAQTLDREAIVDTAVNGQGVLFDSPFLPGTWAYRPDLFTPISHDIISATLALDDAGWLAPEEGGVRQREEERLSLRLLTLDAAPQTALAERVAAAWEQVGVSVTIAAAPDGEALREVLAARDFDVALVEITPFADPDLYDFWSQEAIIRGQNYAGWNNRRASEALEDGRQLWGVAERRPFYETFLRIFANELPAVTLYQHVDTTLFSAEVAGIGMGEIDQPRERYASFADWHLEVETVEFPCPMDE